MFARVKNGGIGRALVGAMAPTFFIYTPQVGA